MDCLVLAGGRPAPDHPLYAETRGAPKALIEVGGRPMIEWVLEALRGAASIDRPVDLELVRRELRIRGH